MVEQIDAFDDGPCRCGHGYQHHRTAGDWGCAYDARPKGKKCDCTHYEAIDIADAPVSSSTPDEQAADDAPENLTSGRYLIEGDIAEGRDKSLVGSAWLLDLMDGYERQRNLATWCNDDKAAALAALVVVREQLTAREAELASLKEYLTESAREGLDRNRRYAEAVSSLRLLQRFLTGGLLAEGNGLALIDSGWIDVTPAEEETLRRLAGSESPTQGNGETT